MKQLKLFSHPIEPIGTTQGGTEEKFQSGVELSSRLEKQRALTTNLLEKILEYENLNRAYQRVRGN